MECPKPLGPTPLGACKWSSVDLKTQMTFQGGYQKKSHPLDLQAIHTTKGTEHFVAVRKTEIWLLAACRGPSYRRGDLSRSKIIEILKTKAEHLEKFGDNDDDPMAHIVCDDADGPPPEKKKKKTSPLKRREDQVLRVEVDLVPKAADPTSTAKKSVRVLLCGRQKLVHVHSEDLPWLVAYIADEVNFGGVVSDVSDVASAVAEANTTVPGLRVEWDFQQLTWTGSFVSGPLQGRSVSCAPTNMTDTKWNQLMAAERVTGTWDAAALHDVDEGARLYLEMHCENLLGAARAGGEDSQ